MSYVNSPQTALSMCRLALSRAHEVDAWILIAPDGSMQVRGILTAYCHGRESKLKYQSLTGALPRNPLAAIIPEVRKLPDDTTVIFVDQHTTYVAPDALRKLAAHKQARSDIEALYPCIIGTERATYIHQVMGCQPTWLFGRWDAEYIDSLDFSSSHPNLQAALHLKFLASLNVDPEARQWAFGECSLKSGDRVPWSCVAFTTGETASAWLSRIIDKHTNHVGPGMPRTLLCGDSVMAHVGFSGLIHNEADKILNLYAQLPAVQGSLQALEWSPPSPSKFQPTPENTLFVISSHKSLEQTEAIACMRLLYAVCGVNKERILIVSGGYSEPASLRADGVRIERITDNSYEHGGLIYALDAKLDAEFVFMLHDTSRPGPNFAKHIFETPVSSGYVACLEEGWLNMGLFSMGYLKEHEIYVKSLRNCSKMRAILSEKIYSRFSGGEYYQPFNGVRFDGYQALSGSEDRKSVFYMPMIDLYKHQTYYLQSPKTQALFRSHLMNAKNALDSIQGT